MLVAAGRARAANFREEDESGLSSARGPGQNPAGMARASARILVLALGLSGSAVATEPSNEPAALPLTQPSAPLPPQEQQAPPLVGTAPQADRAEPSGVETTPVQEPPKLPWHDTWLLVDNSVTAQTIGIGGSYQSSNPTYDLSASLRPRYYFYDEKKEGFYVSGRIDVVREFTNSDVTTQSGETLVGGGGPHRLGPADPTLFTAYRRQLAKRGDYETTFSVLAPVFTFPLSKFSQNNGTYLGLGGDLRLYQDVPLAGMRSAVFKKLMVGGIVGYNHTFTRTTTETNTELRRLRLDPEGRTVPGDQLTGKALPMHEMRATLRFIVDVAKDFTWWTDFVYEPTWLYPPPVNSDIRILSGTVTPTRTADPTTFITVTGFETSFYYHLLNELTLGLGYANVTPQPGPDGLHRNIFYGPGAQFSFFLLGHLDEMYLTAAGRRSGQSAVNR